VLRVTAAPPAKKHFSMIREFHLADFFTLGNAACGTASVFASMAFARDGAVVNYLVAAALLPIALVFDALDGRIARFRQNHSSLGRELDSLADIISFGVAPAALAHAAGMTTWLDSAALVYFVVCGVSRLARYNVTAEELSAGGDKVRYFEGTPIPTSVLLVAWLGVAALRGAIGSRLDLGVVGSDVFALHPLVLAYVLSGSLMISKTLHVPKL
jgi:CDP-diacylglycerol--serine O-phosphatidyltransferase